MVWLVCEGGRRYFRDRCEYEINRIKKIRDNCNVMIKVGLLPPGSSYPNYNKDKWKEETELLKQLAAAEERFAKGLEPYEEQAPAGYIPDIPENHVKTPRFKGNQDNAVKQEPQELPGPSSKVVTPGRSYNTATSCNYGNRGNLKQIDYNKPLPPLLELELLQVPDHMEKLTDLLVTKQLTRLSNIPVDIRKIYKDIKHDTHSWINDSSTDNENSDNSCHEESDRSFTDEDSDRSCNSKSFDNNLYDSLSDTDSTDSCESDSYMNDCCYDKTEDKKWKHKTIKYKGRCSELFSQFQNLGFVMYSKNMKEAIRDLHRIEISSDEEEETVTTSQTSNTPTCTPDKTPDIINNNTPYHINNNTPDNLCNNTPDNINNKTPDNLYNNTLPYVHNTDPKTDFVKDAIDPDGITIKSSTFHSDSVSKKFTAVANNVTPDSDDDFDYLATIPDEYLMKLFTDDPAVSASFRNKISDNKSDIVFSVDNTDNIFSSSVNTHANLSDSFTDNVPASLSDNSSVDYSDTVYPPQRKNPSRKAKENVDYKSQLKEDILVSQYYCWKCKGLTIEDTICETHGDLLPCLEPVPNQKKKNPVYCPVPSFVKVQMSNIPNSGYGVIATKFIEPGQIIGEYHGKKITQEKYRELEKKKLESGYAWKVTKKDGKVVYIDGASYRSSNWLRYLNCARGLYEENVMCRVYQGKIQYYTCKTIAIGSELLVYYGDEYFTELGYVLPDYNKSEKQHHCKQCYKLFNTRQLLQEHVCGKQRRRTQKERKYQCDICGNMFTYKHSLTRHISNVHDKIKQHSCPYCQYRTNRKLNLTTHISTHTGEHRYKCTLCDYTTVQHFSFTQHMYRNHTNKSYKCRYTGCKINKPTLEELHEHIRSEHPVRRYKCDMCPMSYDHSSSYKFHKLTHQDKQYQCTYCDKKFTQSQHLSRHLVTHTGEKKYTCTVCNKQFSENSTLTKHMRIHTGVKPYSCSYCYMAFTHNFSCKKHEIICADRRY